MPSRRPSGLARLCLSAGVALMAACQQVPPVPLGPAERADIVDARRLDSPEVDEALERTFGPRAARPHGEAWTLDELTVAALTLRSDLDVASAAARVAAAQIETAGQRPNPTLNVVPQRVGTPVEAVSPWLTVVQLDWKLETAGKRSHRLAAAKERARAADLRVRDSVWGIRLQVYDGLAAVVAADTRLGVIEHANAAQDELVRLLERQIEVGAISEASVAPQLIAQVQLAAELAAASRQAREARSALAAALGVPTAALSGVEFDFPLGALSADVDTLASGPARRTALLGRSDVLALLADYDAAEADLRLELAKQIPDVRLGPAYEFDQGASKWGLVASIDLPLLYQNQGGIAEAEARRAEIAARFDALQARIIAEVEGALASLDGARAEVASASSLVATTREGQRLARASFEAGAIERSGLLIADLAVYQATRSLIDAQERAQVAAASLERAVQPVSVYAPAPDTEVQ